MRILIAIAAFLFAAICETSGLLLGWKVVKEGKPLWFIPLGICMLTLYMFVNTSQAFSFGRAYAIYGGVFIGVAVLWGMIFDGFRPDKGDLYGLALVFVGIAVLWLGIGRHK